MEQELLEGNVNPPILKNNKIYKKAHKASWTIDLLLKHVRKKGMNWIPESYGIDNGFHVIEYLKGKTIHNNPRWIWEIEVLIQIATMLRQWHDATQDFECKKSDWLLANFEKKEVICHNDFAPYNILFINKKPTGLIDFDTCSPGSRLWDISYAAYRFIPIFPMKGETEFNEYSLFTRKEVLQRLKLFLKVYGHSEKDKYFSVDETFAVLQRRLEVLAQWSEEFGKENRNPELLEHAKMYFEHSQWISLVLGSVF